MDNILDVVIIGAGPAGISASIYANRAMLKFEVLEKFLPGGEIANTYEVDNYPGLYNVSGLELSTKMIEHAESLGVRFKMEEVKDLNLKEDIKKVITDKTTYLTKTIIIATGASPRKLGALGEELFIGKGVSFCATCDGALFKGKTVVVVGGGDVAVEYAIYLSRMCKKVYLVHRRHELRAVKVLQSKLFAIPTIEMVWDSNITEICGDDVVKSVRLINNVTSEKSKMMVDGVFVAVGMDPNFNLCLGKIDTAKGGWIVTDENCETNVPGVFAVGDVRKKMLRQVVTSVADGAVAVFACEKYL